MSKAFDWDIPAQTNTNDPLLSCLIMLSQYYKCPCSARTLTAHLPLVDNKLTPELFIRAAERAHLSAEIHEIKLQHINQLTLPTVLLLKTGSACLLLDKNDHQADVFFMETGSGVNTIELKTLQKEYSGIALFVKPTYQFSQRSKESFKKQERNWFWKVVFRAWPIYTEVLVASALINAFALAIPLFVMNVYDRVVPNQATETLWVLAFGVVIVFMFDFLLRTLRSYFIDSAGKKVDVELSSRIFNQILGIEMEARPKSVGALANTVQSFEIFRDFITSTTITVLVDLPFVFLYIFIISLIGGNIFLIPLLMLPIVCVIGLLLQLPLTRLTRKSYQYAAEKQATLIESLAGIEAIKTTGAEGHMQQRWEQVITLAAKLGNRLRFVTNSSVNFTLLCQQMVSVAVVIYGVYKINAGELTMGALIACTILSGRALAPMSQVAGIFARYFQSMNALRSIHQVMQMPTDIVANKTYLHRPNFDGRIDFRSVNFAYENDSVQILSNVSFTIKPGERVALIGRIGSGKSSVAKLIMGLYQPTSGSILVDGTDTKQLNPADLRFQIGYVPQDIVLFYGTVKANITLGAAHVDDKTVLRAANLAGVDTFIKRHPQGYDLQVGERGCNLSGGQRQAIAVARALVLNPKLLVMDEPTASMDDSSEQLLFRHLDQLLHGNKTLVLITHKASMLNLVNRVIVMDGGRVIADGPKEAVLSALRTSGNKGKSS